MAESWGIKGIKSRWFIWEQDQVITQTHLPPAELAIKDANFQGICLFSSCTILLVSLKPRSPSIPIDGYGLSTVPDK